MAGLKAIRLSSEGQDTWTMRHAKARHPHLQFPRFPETPDQAKTLYQAGKAECLLQRVVQLGEANQMLCGERCC